MVEKDSFDHVVKTTAQWESQSFEYWIIPRGVLCVELTPDKKTKIKIGEGNKIYSQLPYINSETDLSDYYTKEEIDNILAMLNFVAIPSSEIYPTKESLPQTGNRQGDLRFVLNVGGDPYSYLWFNDEWIQVGGVDLSEYAKKSEVNPRLNALELKAHTHMNKNVLDRLTANVIDDSHRHTNKNILDATTASYTTQDKATLDELAAITIFEGATKTEDGTMGYVPAPLHGQHTYFLKGDGSWAYLDPGDKYKAGEGIYILSGEVTAQTFPFKLYAKGGYVKQYIIYGAPGGVGDYNSTSGKYHIPIQVSAEGHTSITTVVQIRDPLYENDWINYDTQEYCVSKTNLTNAFQNLIAIEEMSGIDVNGNFNKPPGRWPQFALSDYYEIEADAQYELPAMSNFVDVDYYQYANVNMYDENKNRTRTILRGQYAKVIITPLPGEKYLRIASSVSINWGTGVHSFVNPVLYRLKEVITPVPSPLEQIQLIPNAINTIDVLTTTKPLDVYMETYIPEEPDPEDPLSGYSGIIYNDGVLDVTQEDPNNLNELTVHFRENVEKTLTIPTYELPIASDTTLGGIKVGANLTIDEDGVLDAITKSGDKYKAGEGIYILSGEVISDTFPFEIFPKTSRTSQYVIYGSEAGVGDWDGTNITLSITISAPGETTLTTQILYNAKLYSGDYLDYSRQIIHHSKQDMRQYVSLYNHPSYGTSGIFQTNTGSVIANYNAYTGITDYIEVNPGEVYMVQAFVPYDTYDTYFTTFHCIFDENYTLTRYFRAQYAGVITIEIQPGEKYARFVGTPTTKMLQPGFLYKLEPYEEPCVLPSIILYANKVNTINVSNTNKPSEIYFEAASDGSVDPEDPTSEFTGIIYNEGVLDVTQEDPNALNELTFHFRDNVDKTLTIPSAPLPIASDTTLGGIIVGDNLTIDEDGVLSATGGGTQYEAGTGINIISDSGSTVSRTLKVNAQTAQANDYTIYGATGGVGEPSINLMPALTMSSIWSDTWYADGTHEGKPAFSKNTWYGGITNEVYLTEGTYTFSLDVKLSSTSVQGLLANELNDRSRYPHYDQAATVNLMHYGPFYPVDTDWHRYSYTFEVTSAGYVACRAENVSSSSATISVARPQLEVGSVAHDYVEHEHYVIPITVSAPNETDIEVFIETSSPLGNGDSLNFIDDSLPTLTLYQNKTNTITVNTTVIPSSFAVDASSGSSVTSIIENDGVLDVTQEDPNALNELTIHFRDNVDKTITIPSTPLPIATDSTLGGIIVGDNLTIDPVTGVLDATGGSGTEYAAGDGIQIDEGTSVIDITNIQWQQGKIDDTDGSEAITGVEPYLDCEMFEITSHTSMVTLSGTYGNNIMLLWKPYYYDENEDYISTVNNWSTYEDGVQIPINAKYVRFVLTEDETTTLDPNDLAHVEIEYPLEVGKEVITNTGVIDIQVRDRKLIITKHNTIEEIPIPDPPVATTSTPGIVTVGQDLTIDQNGVLNIADINRLILNAEE